ncbi:MAG: restriction endonuclease [bacterium]|nr:restriction endonuclease [bacterium]
MNRKNILERWQISEQELTIIVDENPSLRGFLLGYVGEYKLRALLTAHPEVTTLVKPDDHDRKKKNDLEIVYQGHSFTIEVKSLQTNSIRRSLTDGIMKGNVQVDASDRRLVKLSDGSSLETTCLLCGEFDVLAVNLFQFREQWDFAFVLNRDLPKSRSKKYTAVQQNELLATLVSITFPLQPPFTTNPFDLLDVLINESSSPSTSDS